MSASASYRFLRPSIRRSERCSQNLAYLHFYNVVRSYSRATARPGGLDQMNRVQDTIAEYSVGPEKEMGKQERGTSSGFASRGREDVKRRIKELEQAKAVEYPRIKKSEGTMTCKEFLGQRERLLSENKVVTLRGRVQHARVVGSKLIFVSIMQDGHLAQGVCNFASCGTDLELYKRFRKLLKRGDTISISGPVRKTQTGEVSVFCHSLPEILTPTLATLPRSIEDQETLVRKRHADLLVNAESVETLKIRSLVIQGVRNYLLANHFQEVQTPIITGNAGGAVARPFTTHAFEFQDRELSLRIAPELWLKRLIIGGLDRVFEIGPVFRNEGIDATHNPEFYTCEFYQAFASLDELMFMTEQMIRGIRQAAEINFAGAARRTADVFQLDSGVQNTGSEKKSSWPTLSFIPTIEQAIRQKLPQLTSPNAQASVLAIFHELSLPVPQIPTLPRLLDRLCATYIEPLCEASATPIFITHHPACLAPLAKSYIDELTGQEISARAELFVRGCEVANMYEEENSPIEQRRKLVEQTKLAMVERPEGGIGEVEAESVAVVETDGEVGEIDEAYLEAMEWGLAPTGGWGMGLDRLVMLVAGRERIGDVSAFGTLRNVIGGTSKRAGN